MSLDSTIAYRLQSGSQQENSCNDTDGFCKLKIGLRQCLNGGRDTVSISIYFSLKNSCRNRKNSVTKLYFSEFYHDLIFI